MIHKPHLITQRNRTDGGYHVPLTCGDGAGQYYGNAEGDGYGYGDMGDLASVHVPIGAKPFGPLETDP